MNNPSSHPGGTPALPALESLDAAILVPIQGDTLLEPFEAPPDRTARLHAILAGLETHHGVVRDNIISLIRQECARLIIDAQDRERALGTGHPQVPAKEDLDRMVANMQAVGEDENKESQLTSIVVQVPCDGTARENCMRSVMITIERGMGYLSAFEGHVAKTRDFYEAALQREKARDAG